MIEMSMDYVADERRRNFIQSVKPRSYQDVQWVAIHDWLQTMGHAVVLEAAKDFFAYLSWPLEPDPGAITRLGFVDWHQGRCAACGRHGRDDVADHDHMTGLVRGYVCRSCNASEGRSGAPVWDVYRTVPPAALYGIAIEYDRPDPSAVSRALIRMGAKSMWGKLTDAGNSRLLAARNAGAVPTKVDWP